MPALKRVGHKGADPIAPGNTLPSFDAALDAGVDMIEFDVLPEADGPASCSPTTTSDARKRTPPTLEQGLDHLAGDAYEDLELDVDLKLPGYEDRVLDALRERDLLHRSLISTQYVATLADVRRPSRACAWAGRCPRLRATTPRRAPTALPALAASAVYRAASRAAPPARIARAPL